MNDEFLEAEDDYKAKFLEGIPVNAFLVKPDKWGKLTELVRRAIETGEPLKEQDVLGFMIEPKEDVVY